MPETRDIFRPRSSPAREIYDALVSEAEHRKGRESDVWMEAERQAVLLVAREESAKRGWEEPTYEDVLIAEAYACGHFDYAAKFAYRLVKRIRHKESSRCPCCRARCRMASVQEEIDESSEQVWVVYTPLAEEVLRELVAAGERALEADPYGGDHDLWMPRLEAALAVAREYLQERSDGE